MRAAAWFSATDGLRPTSVNDEFEAKDGLANTGFVKDLPALLHHYFNLSSGGKIDMGANASVLRELGCVASAVP